MTIDHISLATNDMAATRAFYEEKLGFKSVIHESIELAEGGCVEHQFFDCGDGACIAFMAWGQSVALPDGKDIPEEISLGYPPGTYHFAFRVASLEALVAKQTELQGLGIPTSPIMDLAPYRSFFLEDPNGYRLEFTVRVGSLTEADRDPNLRRVRLSLKDFYRPMAGK